MAYIATYNGKKFDYDNITNDSFDVEDIFRALPRLNRFVGHSERAYSVAEHSLYCWLMAVKLGYSLREQFLAFTHDFTEAYVNDCPAPLKKMIPQFEEIEKEVELGLYKFFGIKPPTEEERCKVKRIDLTMLAIEMRDLTTHNYGEYIDEHTHIEFLGDEEFIIPKKEIHEKVIRAYLQFVYGQLLRNYLLGDDK